MKFFTIEVPTKTYLRKYLESCYGSPLQARPSTDFGHVLLSTLSSRIPAYVPKRQREVAFSFYTDKMKIQVPMDFQWRIDTIPTEDQIIQINRYFELKFEEEMFHVVERASWMGITRKFAIESFAHNHGIEVDIDVKYDALKQMEYRFRAGADKNRKEQKQRQRGTRSAFSAARSIAAMLFL